METRDIRSEAGLDDRPVILVCGDSGALPTGVARVIRGICQPIVERGEFQVVQHGWFHLEGSNIPVNYRIVPNKRHPADKRLFDDADKWGQESFDKLVANLRPAIVFAVADYTRVDHIRKSPHRTDWAFVHYIPVDTFPPNQLWIDVVRSPDLAVFYTQMAQVWGAQADVTGPYLPHGIETNVYEPASQEQRTALRQKFFGIKPSDDVILIGSVGRNQRRKRHDQLIEAFAHLYHGGYSRCRECRGVMLHNYVLPGGYFEPLTATQCTHCLRSNTIDGGHPWTNAALYLHTDPTEPGKESMPLNKLCMVWQVEQPVKFNPQINLRLGQGLSNEMMASFYQCMDLYVHPADGGGWELPPMEAAACGVPIVAADAPAQNEWLATVPGCKLARADRMYMRNLEGFRHFARTEELVRHMLDYMEDRKLRQEHGHDNAKWARNYDWSMISEQWEKLFQMVISPERTRDRWRVLVEA